MVLGLAAGCGGSDDNDSEPTATGSGTPTTAASTPAGTPTPAPVIEKPDEAAAAVATTRAYLNAFITGDARTVCRLETAGFASKQVSNAVTVGYIKKGSTCIDFVTKVFADSNKANATPSGTPTFDVTAQKATDRRAEVYVSYPDNTGAVPETYVLVKQGGSWLISEKPS